MANIEMNYFNGTSYIVLYPLVDLSNSTGNLPASNISGTLGSSQIPNLDASKITSGTFSTSRIPNLSASKITSGTLSVSRGGTGTTSYSSLASSLSPYMSSSGGKVVSSSYIGTGSSSVTVTVSGISSGKLAIIMSDFDMSLSSNDQDIGIVTDKKGLYFWYNSAYEVSMQSLGTFSGNRISLSFGGNVYLNARGATYYYVAFGT